MSAVAVLVAFLGGYVLYCAIKGYNPIETVEAELAGKPPVAKLAQASSGSTGELE